MDETPAGQEGGGDAHDVGTRALGPRLEASVQHLEREVEIVDHLGSTDSQDAPARAVRSAVVVDLERDDGSSGRRRQLGAGGGWNTMLRSMMA